MMNSFGIKFISYCFTSAPKWCQRHYVLGLSICPYVCPSISSPNLENTIFLLTTIVSFQILYPWQCCRWHFQLPRHWQSRRWIRDGYVAALRSWRAQVHPTQAGPGLQRAQGTSRPGPDCLPLLHQGGGQHGQASTGRSKGQSASKESLHNIITTVDF